MPARPLQSYRDGSFNAANTDAVILGLIPGICRGRRLSPWKSVFRSAGAVVVAPREQILGTAENDGNAHTRLP
jgi:hypothetical protein